MASSTQQRVSDLSGRTIPDEDEGVRVRVEYLDDKTVAVLPTPRSINSIVRVAPSVAEQSESAPDDKSASAQQDSGSESSRRDVKPTQNSINDVRKKEIAEVIVTGTHIRGVAPDSSSLTTYDRAAIDQSGTATVDQLLRKIPQNFALIDSDTYLSIAGSAGSSNISRGTGVNLRGLGQGSTLVLLNGHRLAPAGTDGSFTDVSLIPLSAVDHVDVLTDGASAIYGADAVAGVVNFVLRRSFDGAESSVRYGDATRGGGREITASHLFGRSWRNGSAILAYEYDGQNGLRTAQRDFIPDQGGPFQIEPAQHRQNAFLSGRQTLANNTSASADLFYGQRSYAQDLMYFGKVEHDDGRAKQYGATIGLENNSWGSWQIGVSGGYAKEEEEGFVTIAGVLSNSRPRSQSDLVSAGLRGDGSVFSAPGGDVRASVGAGFRRDGFDDLSGSSQAAGIGLKRSISSAYSELFVPVVGEPNHKSWADRFELSLAVRFDHYDDLGSSTNPKLGALWAPVQWLKFRSTYATSYRVPPLAQVSNRGQGYFLIPLPNANSPIGSTNTAILNGPGNPALQPEKARSLTVGFDVNSASVPGLTMAMTYFHVKYTNRIAPPPIVGSVFSVFDQTTTLGSFIDSSPDITKLQKALDGGATLGDPFGIGLANVQAIVDLRLHNIATSTISGIELSIRYDITSKFGHISLSADGDYLRNLEFRPVSSAATVDLVNTIFNPIDLKLRGGANWGAGPLGAALFVDYANSYQNNLVVPTGQVASWTTADLQLSYRTRKRSAWEFLGGATFSLNLQNITDRDPPRVIAPSLFYNLGYDVTNASPYGRTVSAQLAKRW